MPETSEPSAITIPPRNNIAHGDAAEILIKSSNAVSGGKTCAHFKNHWN